MNRMFLVFSWMHSWWLPAALRRDVGDGAFQNLQQRLLDAFAADVPGDGGILRFPGDLVDFIDVDDAPFRGFDVVVRSLDQPHQDIFHVVAYVSGLGEGGGVGDGKGHVQDLG